MIEQLGRMLDTAQGKEQALRSHTSGMEHHHYLTSWVRGQLGRLWAALTGRSRRLLSLAEIGGACPVLSRRSCGVRTVDLAQIRGSEGRQEDFDCDFYPLTNHTAGRWRGIFAAIQRGTTMPPVELIQVGDVYFVRDGHHRISVAHALGQLSIEAEVTRWEMDGLMPWREPARLSESLSPGPDLRAQVAR
jgi:hypothetical protein